VVHVMKSLASPRKSRPRLIQVMPGDGEPPFL